MSLVIWGVGLWLLRRGLRPGTTGLIVIGLLAVERFLVELVRAKDDRFFGPFTLAQMISLAVLAVVILLGWRRSARLEARTA
jgi:phosphatidylglycerol:prolipoprotein diacylglycerol transferase